MLLKDAVHSTATPCREKRRNDHLTEVYSSQMVVTHRWDDLCFGRGAVGCTFEFAPTLLELNIQSRSCEPAKANVVETVRRHCRAARGR